MDLFQVNFNNLKKEYSNKKGLTFKKDILVIDEEIEDHIVQILFILKESLFFLEGNKFSKNFLENKVNNDLSIYHNNWVNGKEFTSLFPEKIILFLNKYCDKIVNNKKIMNEVINYKRFLNLSLKQREQLGILSLDKKYIN